MCGDLVQTNKVIDTIKSCQTIEQLEVAFNMMCQLKHQWQWKECYSVLLEHLRDMWDYDCDWEHSRQFDDKIYYENKKRVGE